jgi:hypothetical protein
LNHHLYWFCDEAFSWEAAKAYCESLGMVHLATVSSPEENDFIADISSGLVWLGARYFLWITGAEWGLYTNWTEGSLDDWDPDECLFLIGDDTHRGEWDDVPCDETHRFICESDY